MALCSCFACARTSEGTTPQWFLCSTAGPGDGEGGDTPISPPLGASITPNTSNTSAIGTTGNFTNQDINGLLSGFGWFDNVISYSFPTSGAGYGSYQGDTAPSGFQALTAGQQDVARYALGLVSEYAGLTFTELTGGQVMNARIRIAASSVPATSYAYYPGDFPSNGGDIWFGNIRNDPTTRAATPSPPTCTRSATRWA